MKRPRVEFYGDIEGLASTDPWKFDPIERIKETRTQKKRFRDEIALQEIEPIEGDDPYLGFLHRLGRIKGAKAKVSDRERRQRRNAKLSDRVRQRNCQEAKEIRLLLRRLFSLESSDDVPRGDPDILDNLIHKHSRKRTRGIEELLCRLRHPVPHPTIVLEGKIPLIPYHPFKLRDGTETQPIRIGGAIPERRDCPNCKGDVSSKPSADLGRTFVQICESCGSMGEPYDSNATLQRHFHRAQKRENRIKASRHARGKPPILTEIHRRCIWNGNVQVKADEEKESRANLNSELKESDPRFKPEFRQNRDWLKAIGQAPNWRKKLVKTGNGFSIKPRKSRKKSAPIHDDLTA